MPDSAAGVAAIKANADRFAASVGPILSELKGRGLSLRAMAAALSDRGIMTARGQHTWTPQSVANALARGA